MILKSVTIEGYRSIKERERLLVDELVTVLVGANDHGKSNILCAVLSLNEDSPLTADDRHWDLDDDELPSIEWEFQLTEAEQRAVKELRPAPEGAQATDEGAGDGGGGGGGGGSEAPEYQSPVTVTFMREAKGNRVIVLDPGDDVLDDKQAAYLLANRPRVELFEPTKLEGDEVTAQSLETAKFEFMQGIFMKGGLWEQRKKLFVNDGVTSLMLDNGSERLTAALRSEWEQGKELEWKFNHAGNNGDIIRLRIKDPRVSSTYVSPSRRSQGFSAFFVLSLTIYARTHKQTNQSFIYLFDEPGTYLHPHAQVNMQRVFERLAERAQILYSTHSIFMVNKNLPKRNRVVRKIAEGTCIDQKPFSGNWRATRDSLGLLFSQNFLIADRTLLVEGPSDELYWATIFLYLVRSGASDCDMNGFSVAQGGDSRNLVAMASLMLEDGRKVVVLVDGDKSGQLVLKDLRRTRQADIASGNLILLELPLGRSIEDYLPRRIELFEAAVDAAEALVTDGAREWSGPLTRDERMRQLKDMDESRGGKTLGKAMEGTCAQWFKGGRRADDQLSKVAIAMKYDNRMANLRADQECPIEHGLKEQCTAVEESLGLRPRKVELAISEPPTVAI